MEATKKTREDIMKADSKAPNLKIKKSDEIAAFFETLLASTYALYLRTQNYHWNVIGTQFLTFHQMFQDQYEELAEAVDEIAERIRTLGFFPEGSFESFAKRSIFKEEKKPLNAMQMIESLLEGHEALSRLLREHLSFVEKQEDGASADFINKRLALHEKTAWMLRSTLS